LFEDFTSYLFKVFYSLMATQEYEILYSWHSENAEDLSLKAGTTIHVLKKNDHGWWLGINMVTGKKGFFPKTYVRPKNVAEQTEEEKKANIRFSTAKGFNLALHRRQFSLSTIEAFDALVEAGVAIEKRVTVPTNPDISHTSRVTLQCVAMMWDGATTEAQVFSEGVLSFTLGRSQVPHGLEEAMQSLHLDEEADIICAPLMAYGDAGQPPIVPPNCHIVYSVKLIGVSVDASDTEKPAEGDPILFWTGISHRVNSAAANHLASKKAGAVVLVTDETSSTKKNETEITDDMLAKAAAGMGMGK